MSFFTKFTLAAGVIATVGLFFLALGVRKLIRSRAGFPWPTVLSEGFREMLGKRQKTGKGEGLYFSIFGAFIIAICITGVGTLWLTRLAAPKRGALHAELRSTTGFKGSLNWYASERSEVGAKLAERFVDFSFSYPEGWTLETHPGGEQDNVFVSSRRSAGGGAVPTEMFSVAPLAAAPGGQANLDATLRELKAMAMQYFPRHEPLRTGKKTTGYYEGFGYDFAVQDDSGKRTGSFGSIIALSPAVTRQTHGVAVVMIVTMDPQSAPPTDLSNQGEMPVLVQSLRFGLDQRHTPGADIKAAIPTK